jgi:hypothetical protein
MDFRRLIAQTHSLLIPIVSTLLLAFVSVPLRGADPPKVAELPTRVREIRFVPGTLKQRFLATSNVNSNELWLLSGNLFRRQLLVGGEQLATTWDTGYALTGKLASGQEVLRIFDDQGKLRSETPFETTKLTPRLRLEDSFVSLSYADLRSERPLAAFEITISGAKGTTLLKIDGSFNDLKAAGPGAFIVSSIRPTAAGTNAGFCEAYTKEGKLLWSDQSEPFVARTIAVSSDGKLLYSCRKEQSVVVELDTGKARTWATRLDAGGAIFLRQADGLLVCHHSSIDRTDVDGKVLWSRNIPLDINSSLLAELAGDGKTSLMVGGSNLGDLQLWFLDKESGAPLGFVSLGKGDNMTAIGLKQQDRHIDFGMGGSLFTIEIPRF